MRSSKSAGHATNGTNGGSKDCGLIVRQRPLIDVGAARLPSATAARNASSIRSPAPSKFTQRLSRKSAKPVHDARRADTRSALWESEQPAS